jgi:hypothetical protein
MTKYYHILNTCHLQSHSIDSYKIRGLFFFTSDRASKKVRNARKPDLRVA